MLLDDVQFGEEGKFIFICIESILRCRKGKEENLAYGKFYVVSFESKWSNLWDFMMMSILNSKIRK